MVRGLARACVGLMSVLLCVSAVTAQDDCPSIVQKALDVADKACTTTGRNQACYGNITLKAVPQAGVSSFTFDKTGDIVNVRDVQRLALSSMDAARQQWGIALLKVQANIPDTLPGQNVTLLLFGDVDVENAPDPASDTPSDATPAVTAPAPSAAVQVTADAKLDVLAAPARAAAVVGTLAAGDSAPADGMDDSAAWLHVVLADGTAGWVKANKVTIEGDAGSLPVLDASSPPPTAAATQSATATPQGPVFGTMKAFYFKSGANDRPCSQAPDSGILVQTPHDVAGIELTVNAVNITLGSTAYFQAQPNGDMTIYVVEGHGTASAFNRTVTIPAGTRVRIPIGADLRASGPPGDPEPYTSGALVGLPLQHLPEVITSADPLPEDAVAALNRPAAGIWTLTYDQAYIDVGCAADDYNGGFGTELTYDNDTLVWYGHPFSGSGYGVYESGTGTARVYRLAVTSATQIEGQNIWIVPGCATIINHFHLVLQQAS